MQSLCGNSLPFGAKLFIGCGDVRQIPCVVKGPAGNNSAVYHTSVMSSRLWQQMSKILLTTVMRVSNDPEFLSFIDSVGDGTAATDEDGLVLAKGVNSTTSLAEAFSFGFPDLNDHAACGDAAIVATLNVTVDEVNQYGLEQLTTKPTDFYATENLADDSLAAHSDLLSTEYLSTLELPSLPPHCLRLKVGCVCTIERNLLLNEKLAHNSKVVLKFSGKYIEVRSLLSGRIFAIPRISFPAAIPKTTIKMIRRQYPLRPAYGGTVHKIQGMTLKKQVLYLDQDTFTHGQLYVGLSRARHSSDLLILVADSRRISNEGVRVRNVVFPELLNSLQSCPSGRSHTRLHQQQQPVRAARIASYARPPASTAHPPATSAPLHRPPAEADRVIPGTSGSTQSTRVLPTKRRPLINKESRCAKLKKTRTTEYQEEPWSEVLLHTLGQYLLQIGRVIDRSTPAFGNCLFEAIVTSGDLAIDHAHLRLHCMLVANDSELQIAALGESEQMTGIEYRGWMATGVGTAWGGLTEVALCARFLGRPITVVSPHFFRTYFPGGSEVDGWGPANAIVIVKNAGNHYYGTLPAPPSASSF